MTVSMQVSKRIYAGNGVTRQWEVDFPLSSNKDVRVYITSPAGKETELEEDFELNAEGTQLVYPTLSSGKAPLAEGWSLTLERHTPLTQEIDLIRQGEMDAEVLESGYDKLTLMVQELNEKISRSIKYPVSTQVEDLETDTFLKNILDIKQDTLNASSFAVSAAQTAQASAADAQQSAQNAQADIASCKEAAQAEITASGVTIEDALQTYLAAAQEEAATARYYAQHSIGKTVGEVYFSQSAAEADNPGSLPLFTGETIANFDEIYPDFYTWLTEHTELTCTMDEYEASFTQFGECAQYGVAGASVRLPLIKNYVKAANVTDGVTNIEAGLPNITGTTSDSGDGINNTARVTGAFFVKQSNIKSNKDDQWRGTEIGFDASLSSEVYGKSTTVTPASTTLYPWVVVFNTAVPASTAQAAQFQQALSGKADTNLGNVPDNIDYVVDRYSDDNGNWWKLYKSGWLEQGGFYTGSFNKTTQHSLLKPFNSSDYTIIGNAFISVNESGLWCCNAKTETAFMGEACRGTTPNHAYTQLYWEAKGYAAS